MHASHVLVLLVHVWSPRSVSYSPVCIHLNLRSEPCIQQGNRAGWIGWIRIQLQLQASATSRPVKVQVDPKGPVFLNQPNGCRATDRS